MLTGSDRCCPLRSGHWWPRCGPDVAPPPFEYLQSILTRVARAGHHLGIQHSVQRQACVRIEAVEFGREKLANSGFASHVSCPRSGGVPMVALSSLYYEYRMRQTCAVLAEQVTRSSPSGLNWMSCTLSSCCN
jgi:hypothetical protein